MDYHKNAPWTAVSRERLASMVIDDGLRACSTTASCHSERTADPSTAHPPAAKDAAEKKKRGCSAQDDNS